MPRLGVMADARRCRLTVNLQPGKGLHFALLVGGGADVGPGIFVGDPRNRQDVDLLETLGGKFSFQLDGSRYESEVSRRFLNRASVTVVNLGPSDLRRWVSRRHAGQNRV